MNQQERDALRTKHQDWSGHCPVCHTETACDVIKVLDSLDQIAFWVDHRNGMDVHGAIGRIQEMLL
jgi:hypothetical protein